MRMTEEIEANSNEIVHIVRKKKLKEDPNGYSICYNLTKI
jgi:hypothetical protein